MCKSIRCKYLVLKRTFLNVELCTLKTYYRTLFLLSPLTGHPPIQLHAPQLLRMVEV